MSKKRVSRSPEVIETILAGLEEGKTLTSICEGAGMPSISATQLWCRDDADLDEKIFDARVRGILIQRDYAVDALNNVISGKGAKDPKQLQAIVTAARDLNHNTLAMLTRLDKRYSDKMQVENTGPIIISWQKTAEEVVTAAAAKENEEAANKED